MEVETWSHVFGRDKTWQNLVYFIRTVYSKLWELYRCKHIAM